MPSLKKDLTVSQKLILPLVILMLIYLIVLSVGIYSFSYYKILSLLDASMERSNNTIHGYVDFTIRQSMKSYLRGRAEDALATIERIYQETAPGSSTVEELEDRVRNTLLSRKIGDSGYIYVINSSGRILLHPFDELEGTEVSNYQFIRDQIQMKEGYLEYEWENPGETEPRKKALYMLYFPPMDWIISVSAYRNEFQSFMDWDLFESQLLESTTVNYGYSFILDEEGRFLSHPVFEGQYLRDISHDTELTDALNFEDRSEPVSGQLVYRRKDPETGRANLYRAYYSYKPQLGITIVSTYLVGQYRKPVLQMVAALVFSSAVLIIVLTLIKIRIIRGIITPLSQLTKRILTSDAMEDLKERSSLPRDEIALTGELMAIYVDRITEKQNMLEEAHSQNEILAQFPNNLNSPVLRLDEDGNISYMNTAAEGMLESVIDEEQRQISGSLLESFLEHIEEGSSFEFFLLGSAYSVQIVDIPSSDELYLQFYDLTTERRFKTLQNIWKRVLDSSIEGITITDEHGYIERINDSFTRITGYGKIDAIGNHTRILKSNKHGPDFYTKMWASLERSGTWQGEIWNRKKSGEVYPEWLTITSFADMYSGRTKYMAIFHDITDIYEKNEELAYLSSHDSLTDLPNRIMFYEQVEKEIEKCRSTGNTFWVMLLDLHGFSQINDHIGQSWGDKFLLEFARMLKKAVHDEDSLSRLGSDDFGILIKSSNLIEEHTQIISKLNSQLTKSITLKGRDIQPVVNIGISVFPEDGDDSDTLVRKADIAVMVSKAGTTPGGYRFYNEEMEFLLQKRFDLEIDIKKAVEKDEFLLFYQPKASVKSGEITGLEALVRWVHPTKGIVNPGDFIPVLEETGLIIEVGKKLFRDACRMIKRIEKDTGRRIGISVNISAIQFSDPDFSSSIDMIISEEEVDVSCIELEITENIAAMDITETIQILNDLKEKGITISIDDFGTGYSSLSYLINLPYDVLKVDRTFVRPLPGDDNRLALVRSIIGLAKNYNKKTVAEGVENREQLELLRSLGCDYIQGYLLSKPVAEDEIIALLLDSRGL